jgi:sialate O-acetylesterase
MIRRWRELFDDPDLPFGIVQLAAYLPPESEPSESDWAELREAQLMTHRNVEHTGLAVAIDVGDAQDIHPKDKQAVGGRLALWALAALYSRDVAYSGPIYRKMAVEGDAVRLYFDHSDDGLIVRADQGLTGFAIAGEDRKFVWADAEIHGSRVVVSHPAYATAVAVRYGWADNPDVNLVNADGLPASPFRTDDWPGITVPKS